MATTEDTVALQKGAIAPAQKEQTGSQKAVSLIALIAFSLKLFFSIGINH